MDKPIVRDIYSGCKTKADEHRMKSRY